MRIALLFNEKTAPPSGAPDDIFEEYDSLETVEHIRTALRGLNATVDLVPADRRLPWRLEQTRYEFAFNIAEGPLGLAGRARRCREAIAAAVCELLELPYTGSDALTLALTLDKAMARHVVSSKVPVAGAVLVEHPGDELAIHDLRFPVIVKPNDEGSSKGIREDSLAGNPGEAIALARRLRQAYACPALVEEFLPGPEITVAVAGNGCQSRILGMMEIAPLDETKPFLYSLEVKRDYLRRVAYHVPPRLDCALLETLSGYALAAYQLLGCRDIARIDFRLDGRGRPCFLECNALPGLNRETSDIVILSRHTLGYEKLVQGILIDGAQRAGVPVT